jgi:hypothetical protein
MRRFALLLVCVALSGCGPSGSGPGAGSPAAWSNPAAELSDPAQVTAADYSILFVGNSHTSMHDLPDLVARMIRHRHPTKTVLTRTLGVAFLEEADSNPAHQEEIARRPWKQVVLQAQKVSSSGRVNYSTAEGIELAKAGKNRGADVVFYAEWGLRGKAGDGPRMEKVYQGMADASGARVAGVGRAWDAALAKQPDLPLYAEDGNHQSAVGAFLTAAALFAALTGESPAVLADFPYPDADAATRKLLADAAAEAVVK